MNLDEQYKLSRGILSMHYIFEALDEYFEERTFGAAFADEDMRTVYTRVFNSRFGYPLDIQDEDQFSDLLDAYIVPLYDACGDIDKKSVKMKDSPSTCFYTIKEVNAIIWFVQVFAQYAGIFINENDWISGKWVEYARL